MSQSTIENMHVVRLPSSLRLRLYTRPPDLCPRFDKPLTALRHDRSIIRPIWHPLCPVAVRPLHLAPHPSLHVEPLAREENMEGTDKRYVVYEHHHLRNLSEATGSREERTLHKALKPRQVSQSSTSELSLILCLDVDDCPGRSGTLGLYNFRSADLPHRVNRSRSHGWNWHSFEQRYQILFSYFSRH